MVDKCFPRSFAGFDVINHMPVGLTKLGECNKAALETPQNIAQKKKK
jgi:hypothetical protein